MKKKNNKSPVKAPQSEQDLWVNVHDDVQMINLGIQPPYLTPRDESVWTKTDHERNLLRTLRHSYKGDSHFHTLPVKPIPVRDKLIIQLKKNKQFSKTTYSMECWQYEIGELLSKYNTINRKTGLEESLVLKYSFNGKTYSVNERPYWFGK